MTFTLFAIMFSYGCIKHSTPDIPVGMSIKLNGKPWATNNPYCTLSIYNPPYYNTKDTILSCGAYNAKDSTDIYFTIEPFLLNAGTYLPPQGVIVYDSPSNITYCWTDSVNIKIYKYSKTNVQGTFWGRHFVQAGVNNVILNDTISGEFNLPIH